MRVPLGFLGYLGISVCVEEVRHVHSPAARGFEETRAPCFSVVGVDVDQGAANSNGRSILAPILFHFLRRGGYPYDVVQGAQLGGNPELGEW